MWEISNISQVISFLYSLILGVLFATLYDILRSVRKVINHSYVAVFIEDIIYFLIIAVISFIFFLSITAGEIRAYILFGILLGFLLFFFTLSKYLISFITLIIKGINYLLDAFSKAFYLIFGKIDDIIVKISKKYLKCFKKGLKKAKDMLYTNRK